VLKVTESAVNHAKELLSIGREAKVFKLLVINPGSTSTKIALYEDKQEILVKTLDHPIEEIEKYEKLLINFK